MSLRVGLCILAFGLLLVLGACGSMVEQVVTPNITTERIGEPIEIVAEGARFTIGPLPDAWRRLASGQADAAFTHLVNNQVIMVNVVYAPTRQANLIALRNHLLFDITSRTLLEQETQEVDNREALWTVVEGRLDGARIKMALLVVRIDDWVYDMAYVTVPEKYDLNIEDFKQFIRTFHHHRNYGSE